jgi:hypothetical protein
MPDLSTFEGTPRADMKALVTAAHPQPAPADDLKIRPQHEGNISPGP